MRVWPRGTGRYLLAVVAQRWLWGLLYWVYLLLGCYLIADAKRQEAGTPRASQRTVTSQTASHTGA